MNDFEKNLKRQSFRPVPPELRAEILAAASTAPRAATAPWWRLAFWPSPYAWATLAAVWLVILGLDFASSPNHPADLRAQTQSSPEIFALLLEQRRLLDELSRPSTIPASPLPNPRASSPGACLAPREDEQIQFV
jgi:hypothetical protein